MSWVGGAWRIGRKESEEEEGSGWDGGRCEWGRGRSEQSVKRKKVEWKQEGQLQKLRIGAGTHILYICTVLQ